MLDRLSENVFTPFTEANIQAVKIMDLRAEPHQALGGITVVEREGVPDFMQGDFDQTFIIPIFGGLASVAIVPKPKIGNDRNSSSQLSLPIDIGQDRVAKVGGRESENTRAVRE